MKCVFLFNPPCLGSYKYESPDDDKHQGAYDFTKNSLKL